MFLQYKRDFSNDLLHFAKQYDCTYNGFINKRKDDNIVIDLDDKILVSIACDGYLDESSIPCVINAIFIPEDDKFGYKSKLIYSGHIAFLKCEFEDKKDIVFYKDDECYPQNFSDAIENGDLLYECEEKGFTRQDILNQIEMLIRCHYDFNFKIKEEDLVVLVGL